MPAFKCPQSRPGHPEKLLRVLSTQRGPMPAGPSSRPLACILCGPLPREPGTAESGQGQLLNIHQVTLAFSARRAGIQMPHVRRHKLHLGVDSIPTQWGNEPHLPEADSSTVGHSGKMGRSPPCTKEAAQAISPSPLPLWPPRRGSRERLGEAGCPPPAAN